MIELTQSNSRTSRVRKAALVEEVKKRVLIEAFKEDHTQEDGDSNEANTIASAPSSMVSPDGNARTKFDCIIGHVANYNQEEESY
uniref:Gag-pol polyprotein n=1 Tax=Rhabditophanes sp. KR3021 TaxID=114890 RepID=A0AC35TPI8_9BILA